MFRGKYEVNDRPPSEAFNKTCENIFHMACNDTTKNKNNIMRMNIEIIRQRIMDGTVRKDSVQRALDTIANLEAQIK